MRALIVDDDPKFRQFVQRGLEVSGIRSAAAGDADEARAVLNERGRGAFDVVLLDVTMPGHTGWELLEELRAEGVEVPVIFVTARHEVEDRIKGLRIGADDYILKPFVFEELLARIEAVVRRRAAMPILEVAGLRIDPARRVVERGGTRIDLSPKEFDLLLRLAEARGEVLTRAQLLHQVWGIDFDPETNVVDALVARLRRRLEGSGQRLIQTIVGKGYRLGSGEVGE